MSQREGDLVSRADVDACIEIVARVVGGPRSLRHPAPLILQMLARTAGRFTVDTKRTFDDLWARVEEFRGEDRLKVPWTPFADYHVDRLCVEMVIKMLQAADERRAAGLPTLGTAPMWGALSTMVGQVASGINISVDALRKLLEEGMAPKKSQPVCVLVMVDGGVGKGGEA